MRAAVFHGRKDVRIEDVMKPSPGPGEVLVKVAAVGICGTDAHEYSHGPSMFPIDQQHPVSGHVGPMIPGHELAGWVAEVGEGVSGFPAGMLIVSGAGIACGDCHWCRRGRTNLCARYSTVGLHQNGALAEYVVVPASTCLDAGAFGLEPDAAALAQPMSIAVHAMRRGRVEPGDVAVVIGAGGIGAFLTYSLVQHQVTVVVADIRAERLEVAGRLGADHLVRSDVEDLAAAIWGVELIPSVIYEVSGSPQGLDLALGIAPRGSRIVLVGLQGQPATLNLRDLSIREIDLIGTNAHVLKDDLPTALALLASRDQGWADVAPVALSLDDLVSEGLEPLSSGTSTRIKTLIDPGAASTRPVVQP